jgi:hypothetical protein
MEGERSNKEEVEAIAILLQVPISNEASSLMEVHTAHTAQGNSTLWPVEEAVWRTTMCSVARHVPIPGARAGTCGGTWGLSGGCGGAGGTARCRGSGSTSGVGLTTVGFGRG